MLFPDGTYPASVYACRCIKQDIPEVEAIIAALTPRLERWWVEAIEDVLRRGDLLLGVEELIAAPLREIDRLSGRTPDGRTRIDIENELERLMVRQLRDAVTSFAPALAREIEEARDTLLLDAALALGLSLSDERLRVIEARIGPLRAGAVQDLQTLMLGRIDTRMPEILESVRSLVRAAVRPSTVTPVVGAPSAVQSLRDELKAILGASSPRQWVPFVTDQWSYRWFNIGQFISARDSGLTLIRAMNNPPRGPDSKTTAFCRWVHRRVIDIGRAEQQIREHVRASLAGDIDALMANWPLLPSKIAEDKGPTAEASFSLNFRRMGLPPYHARCRTVPVPFRIRRR